MEKIIRYQYLILFALIAAGFALRFFLLPFKTHWSDMLFWKNWGENMAAFGPAQFYDRTGSDYLPLYPLILGLVKKIHDYFAPGQLIDSWYKLPAVMFDILTSLVIWKLLDRKKLAVRIGAVSLYLFNPAFFTNSAMWGQVDSIGTCFTLAAFMFMQKRKVFASGIVMGLAIVTKPLFILAMPLLVIMIGWQVRRFLVFSAALLSTVWLVCYPFTLNIQPFSFVYQKAMLNNKLYPYSTVNAFNAWFLFDRKFWFSDAGSYTKGNIILAVIAGGITGMLLFCKGIVKERLWLALGAVFLGAFLFLTRMHERHMFYGLPFLLLAAAAKPRLLPAFIILSITYTANLHFALENFLTGGRFSYSVGLMSFLSFINIVVFFWILAEFIFFTKKGNPCAIA